MSASNTFDAQRARIDAMLASFVRLFVILAGVGACVSAIYGLGAGTGRSETVFLVSSQQPAAHTAAAGGGARQAVIKEVMLQDSGGASQGVGQSFSASLTAAIIALAISGAAAATGAGTGFLFGLPRTLTASDPGTAAGGGQNSPAPPGVSPTPGNLPGLSTNTNLEQISDWLTKIIVGVGLTKLDGLPSAIEGFGNRTAEFFGFGGKAFGIAAGLYFLIVGFFIGYILTRTKLTWIFVGSQRENTIIDQTYANYLAAVAQAAGQGVDPMTTPLSLPPPPGGGGPAPSPGGPVANAPSSVSAPTPALAPVAATPDTVVKADQTVLDTPLTNVNSTDELAARAAAEARAGRLAASAVLYADIAKVDPTSRHLVDYAGVLGLLGRKDEGNAIVNGLASISQSQQDRARQKMLVGLLRSGLYNGKYEDSIQAGEALMAMSDRPRDAWTSLWLACAYGQRHAQLTKHKADPQLLQDTVGKVVNQINIVVTLNPGMKAYIRSLYDPEAVTGTENDLVTLWPNNDLDKLLT
jgi:hypothetical protein